MTIERNVDLALFRRPPALLLRRRFAANNWLIQRLEAISATVLSASELYMVLLPPGTLDIEKEMKRSENPDSMDADKEEVAEIKAAHFEDMLAEV
uniref:Uncharacterized protein n=2 Tax=Helianthus annuus TaxID=4232 RepID=A0A251T5F2_HELAN